METKRKNNKPEAVFLLSSGARVRVMHASYFSGVDSEKLGVAVGMH
jgi:hypothetical protein